MGKNKQFNALTSQYIDPFYILNLVRKHPNDQQLGEQLREYMTRCHGKAENDEFFFKHASLNSIAQRPSDLREKMETFKEKTHE